LEEALRLNQQAIQLLNQGQYTAAMPLAERALAIREKVLGKEHPDVARSLNNLAELYRKWELQPSRTTVPTRLGNLGESAGQRASRCCHYVSTIWQGCNQEMGNYSQADHCTNAPW
jgi:hypothetical protein